MPMGWAAPRAATNLSSTRASSFRRAPRFSTSRTSGTTLCHLGGQGLSCAGIARVKDFKELFAGANNTAIGNLGEMIALDVMLALRAKAVVKHPIHNHHYDILYVI